MRKLTYANAICEAQIEEMTRDDSVFIIGEDVDIEGGVFNLTMGVLERFGKRRLVGAHFVGRSFAHRSGWSGVGGESWQFKY